MFPRGNDDPIAQRSHSPTSGRPAILPNGRTHDDAPNYFTLQMIPILYVVLYNVIEWTTRRATALFECCRAKYIITLLRQTNAFSTRRHLPLVYGGWLQLRRDRNPCRTVQVGRRRSARGLR